MMYQALKHLHLTLVVTSLSLFVLRGYWAYVNSSQLRARWVRVVPHVNDALLLGAAMILTVLGGWNPLGQPWMLAKIGGLLLYIGLGFVALKPGRPRLLRLKAGLIAIGVYLLIVHFALSKSVGLI